MLLRILYVSELAPQTSPAVVADILRAARHNNENAKITGLLVFDGQRFAQYLEGPAPELLELLSKLAQDARHVGMACLENAPADGRQFHGWHMAFALCDEEHSLGHLAQHRGDDAVRFFLDLLPRLDLEV